MSGPTQPSEPYFDKGLWGWLSSQWIKLPILWGFGGVVEEALSNTSLPAGNSTIDATAVPANEIYVIENICYMYNGTAPTRLEVQVVGLAAAFRLEYNTSITSQVWYSWSGRVVLQEADYLSLNIVGATAGDTAHLRYAGYKMRIG